MEQVKGRPYFCDVQETLQQFPYLDRDIECDVLIVGGGIMGALANYRLSQTKNVVLVEKSRLGFGCSSCSTALLEYNLDDDATTLSAIMDGQTVAALYRMGQEGLQKIDDFVAEHGNRCQYKKRDVLLFSAKSTQTKQMKKEYRFLQKHGFTCEWVTRDTNRYPFPLESGILLPESGAEANTYLLVKELIEESVNHGQIFENTSVEFYHKKAGGYTVVTGYGHAIQCKQIVFATGFQFDLFSDKSVCDSYMTFSVVTQPLSGQPWKNDALVQDTEDPYHYMRRLPDGRVLIGGEDMPFDFGKDIKQSAARKRYDQLTQTLKTWLPNEKIEIEYEFCGAFGGTDNNLGLIGKLRDQLYLFLSMGANGIVNAFFAIDHLMERMNGGAEKGIMRHFSPSRAQIEVETVKNAE